MKLLNGSLSRWMCGLVLGGTLGAFGCGDNLSLDLFPRDVPNPESPAAANTPSTSGEFFIPDGGDVPTTVSRFVKNGANSSNLTYIPDGTGSGSYYWVTRGVGVWGILGSEASGGAAHVVAVTDYQPANLVGDRTHLFWSGEGTGDVYSLVRDGGEPVNIYHLSSAVTSLALTGHNLYVGEADGDIVEAERGKGQHSVLTSADGVPNQIVLIGDSLFWSTYAEADGGLLSEYRLDKGTTTEVLAGFDFDNGIVVDDTSVYWADPLARSVLAVDREGGEPWAVAKAQYQLSALTADRFHLYFATSADGLIKSVPKNGGPVTKLNAGVSTVDQLVLGDDSRLFILGANNIFYIGL